MKVKKTTYEVEGTAEELHQAGLLAEFMERPARVDETVKRPETNGASDHSTHPAGQGALPEAVEQWVTRRVRRGEASTTAREFLAEVLSWEGVRAVPNGGERPGRYLRLHRRHSQLGAFAYMNPDKLTLRLDRSRAEGRKYAYARDVVPTNPHQLVIRMDEAGTLNEGLELARQAYEEAI